MLCLSTIYLLPAFVVLISREIVCQRRSRHLATEDAGVDKLPDYLRSSLTEKNKSTFLDSGHYMLSNGELSKKNSPPEVVKAHASEPSVQQH